MVRWSVLEFVARGTDHIPESGQQLIRNWGYYSNASRGKRRLNSELEAPPAQEGNDLVEQDVDGWPWSAKTSYGPDLYDPGTRPSLV